MQLGATLERRRAGYHFRVELLDRAPLTLTREVRDLLGALEPDGVLLTPPSCDDARVLAAVNEAGLSAPRDVSVAGFDASVAATRATPSPRMPEGASGRPRFSRCVGRRLALV